MTYIKIGENMYPATINGKISDRDWDNRESKSIVLDGDYNTIDALFVDDLSWSIIQEEIIIDEDGKENTVREEYDNSEFSIRGDLTVHTDGTVTVKMGKPTAEEILAVLLGEV